MEPISTLDQSESETKNESASDTSKQKRSRSKGGANTTREAKARILQQAAFDYGAKVSKLDANTVILVLADTRLENGNLVPITSANTKECQE